MSVSPPSGSQVSLPDVLDRVLGTLLAYRHMKPCRMKLLMESDIRAILKATTKVFITESMLLAIKPPLYIAGDIHGSFFNLLRLFEMGGYPPKSRYLFLGDYVDRGKNSIEVVLLLFALKLKYPHCIYLLLGNHETADLNKLYGFYDECKRKYNLALWKCFNDCFRFMPIASLVAGKIFCCHGGLSPDLQSLNQIECLERPLTVPDSGICCDLVWADPEKDFQGWGHNDRGVSYIFGEDVVEKFTRENGLDLICRAHQVVEDGYEFFANRKLVTLFSAPNYCNEFTNSAALLYVNRALVCSLHVLDPMSKLAHFTRETEGSSSSSS